MHLSTLISRLETLKLGYGDMPTDIAMLQFIGTQDKQAFNCVITKQDHTMLTFEAVRIQ